MAVTDQYNPVSYPKHYVSHPSGIEVVTYARLLPYGLGSAVKYVMRRELKEGSSPTQNLDKAIWFLNDSIDNHISYSLTATMHKRIQPVIEHEPNSIVKSFLASLYCQIPGRWLVGNYPDLDLARDLIVALREDYTARDQTEVLW